MSTNFYFKIKAKIDIKTNASEGIDKIIKEKIEALLEEVSEIHIGKRYSYWNSLFEKTEYYSSVKEIKEFYEKNKENLIVVDECDREYAFEDLQEELFTWDKTNSESHVEKNSIYYYLDDQGFEFAKESFS